MKSKSIEIIPGNYSALCQNDCIGYLILNLLLTLAVPSISILMKYLI